MALEPLVLNELDADLRSASFALTSLLGYPRGRKTSGAGASIGIKCHQDRSGGHHWGTRQERVLIGSSVHCSQFLFFRLEGRLDSSLALVVRVILPPEQDDLSGVHVTHQEERATPAKVEEIFRFDVAVAVTGDAAGVVEEVGGQVDPG